jgi:ethanolamine permease
MAQEPQTHRGGVGYEQVGSDYLEKRQLKRGAAGWVLLAGLGVAYVISGDFAGWNFGLAEGGWGGLLIATILMGTMYTCMVFALAELSSTISTAGGGYGFGRRALGPWGGFLTGTAILIEYVLAPAAIVTFIGAYVESLDIFGITAGWPVYLAFYAIFVGIQLLGVGEALKVTFAITAIAVVALLVFCVGMISEFSTSNLTDIPPDDSAGASDFLPFGWAGIWAAFPYAIWFFLAIEGVPLAAEETRDPKRDMPRGLIAGMMILLVFAALMLFIAPGGAGSSTIAESGNPLPEAIDAAKGDGTGLSDFVNWVGLFGLIASFFSIIFAYSRQLFALSRAGYFPRALSVTSGRKVPWLALVLPAFAGFLLAAFWEDQGARILNIAVFGAAVSYVLMMLSHIVLRSREPDLERPYRTPGGTKTSGVALVLAVLAVVATFLVDETAAFITLGVYAAAAVYFGLFSRHHLVGAAPEEEFDTIAKAEAELAGSH